MLFDYSADEIFARLDGETQHVLLSSAVLPFVTPGLARSLSGCSADGDIIDGLCRRSHFVSRCPGRDACRLHPLFRDFLKSRLASLRSPAEHRALVQQAARLLGSSGYADEALDLYVAAGDWRGAVQTLVTLAPALAEQGRLATLERHIRSIPQAPHAESPWIEYWLGVFRRPAIRAPVTPISSARSARSTTPISRAAYWPVRVPSIRLCSTGTTSCGPTHGSPG